MAGGMSRQQALASVDRMVNQQAFTMAVTDVFYLSAMLFFGLVVLVWLSKPALGKVSSEAAAAH
jgi:MFS transporter, DHA2 family, multidrug resistance protein